MAPDIGDRIRLVEETVSYQPHANKYDVVLLPGLYFVEKWILKMDPVVNPDWDGVGSMFYTLRSASREEASHLHVFHESLNDYMQGVVPLSAIEFVKPAIIPEDPTALKWLNHMKRTAVHAGAQRYLLC